ncbi:MAG: hypothetical protein C4289_12840 [Chloroflexota bacterium]
MIMADVLRAMLLLLLLLVRTADQFSAVTVVLITFSAEAEIPGPLPRVAPPQPVQATPDPAVRAGWTSIESL